MYYEDIYIEVEAHQPVAIVVGTPGFTTLMLWPRSQSRESDDVQTPDSQEVPIDVSRVAPEHPFPALRSWMTASPAGAGYSAKRESSVSPHLQKREETHKGGFDAF